MSVMPEESNPELLDVSEAQHRLLDNFAPLGALEVHLADCADRVLAVDIESPMDLPPFSNSAMDGFAVLESDVADADRHHPVTLDVVMDITAGKVTGVPLKPGKAARIMTGALVPDGAEAVVPVELTDFNDRQPGVEAPKFVKIYKPVVRGAHIRFAGEDVKKGDAVMHSGLRLRPQDVGFLSMLGLAKVPVVMKPRVAIFSTGDELLPVEAPLTPGTIHDTNTYTLISSVENCGGDAINLGIVPDRPESVQACLDRASDEKVDLILSSAGVSVGAMDFVRSVVEQGGSLNFWRVNMRPGKPLAFGHYRNIPFVGLPGNPVSAFIGFEVFVRPAILKLLGLKNVFRNTVKVYTMDAIESDGRESYLRAIVSKVDGQLTARLTGHQGSGNLFSLVQANALILIPSGVKSLPSGTLVDAWILNIE